MDYIKQITEFIPTNEQESQDKKVILDYINQFPHNILLRDNEFAHITSSSFIMNKTLDKVLMVYHNIRSAWALPGGHADGEADLMHVAIKEAKEETGINNPTLFTNDIASIDIFPVYGHVKNGKYVNPHLHLSISYIIIASEEETLTVKEDENSEVSWFTLDRFTKENFMDHDIYLYNKLIERAKQINRYGK